MVPFGNRYKSFPILFILFLISVPFLMSHYFPRSHTTDILKGVEQRKAGIDLTQNSRVIEDKIFLIKNSSITINKCKLVFKGVEKKIIHLDVYLLEFDPQYAYRKKISSSAAKKGIRVGDSEFQLVSVKKDTLILKIRKLLRTY